MNLHTAIAAFFEGRGYFMSAGQDHLPGYIAHQLKCSTRVREIAQVLLDAADDATNPLYVEHDRGRITRVGLKSWVSNPDITTEPVVEDFNEAWAIIGRLRAQLALSQRLGADGELALELLVEYEASNRDLTAQLEQARLELASATTQLTTPNESDSEEVVALKARVDTLQRIVANNAESRRTMRERHREEMRALRKRLAYNEPPAKVSSLVEELVRELTNGRGGTLNVIDVMPGGRLASRTITVG